MFSLKLIRSALCRPLVVNQVSLSKYANSAVSYADRYRKELLDHFEETNSQVYDRLKESVKSSKIDWAEIREKLIKDYPRAYNKLNFEVQFMQYLLKIDCVDDEITKSFIVHVKKVLMNENNKVIQCHLIRFLLATEKNPDANYIKSVLETLIQDEIFIKYPVVGKAWSEYAALSVEACKQSIDFASKHIVLQNDALATLVTTALKFGLYEDSERLLLLYKQRKLTDQVVESWMECLTQIEKSKRLSEIDRFIRVLHDKRYLFQKIMFNKVENFFLSLSFHSKTGIIDPEKRACKVCDSTLEFINEKELIQLQSAVETYLLKREGGDYIISTPREIANFKNFLHSHSSEPFDLIIDGLNVSYYNTTRTVAEDKKTHSLSIKNLGLSESLYETMEINNILGRYKKILVIGRKHMTGWPSIIKLKEKHYGQVWTYLLDNKSEDDIFTIYAACQNIKTYIWTADFLRQYKDLLDHDNSELFEKWKFCRQIRFAPGSKRRLEFPNKVDYICQTTKSGFYHIPVNMNGRVDHQERIIAHWLCIGHSSR